MFWVLSSCSTFLLMLRVCVLSADKWRFYLTRGMLVVEFPMWNCRYDSNVLDKKAAEA